MPDLNTADLELAVLRAKFLGDRPRPKYSPDQPRDELGRFGETGGGTATATEDLYGGHAGTKEDPVPCGSDIERAAIIIGDGGNVTLSQPEEVATLLDKVQEMVKDAQSKGQEAPVYNMCNASVEGTNLFCQDEVTRPDGTTVTRVQMPQLATKDPVPGSIADGLPRNQFGEVDMSQQFAEYLAETGRPPVDGVIDAKLLRASQDELNGDKVAGIADKYASGEYDPKTGTIWVTNDNYIIDGHHRWAATISEEYRTDTTIEIPVHKLDMDIGQALTLADYWTQEQGIAGRDAAAKRRALRLAYSALAETPELLDVVRKLSEPRGKDASALIAWFNDGADGAIDWGAPGDFDQCVAVAENHMDTDQAHGFCQLRHMDATGMTTSEHAHQEGKAETKFSEDQPRDDHGRFAPTEGGVDLSLANAGQVAGMPTAPTATVTFTAPRPNATGQTIHDEAQSRIAQAREHEGEHALVIMRDTETPGSHTGTLSTGPLTINVDDESLNPLDIRQLVIYGNWGKSRGGGTPLVEPAKAGTGSGANGKYSPDQPRDERGRFGEGDGGAGSALTSFTRGDAVTWHDQPAVVQFDTNRFGDLGTTERTRIQVEGQPRTRSVLTSDLVPRADSSAVDAEWSDRWDTPVNLDPSPGTITTPQVQTVAPEPSEPESAPEVQGPAASPQDYVEEAPTGATTCDGLTSDPGVQDPIDYDIARGTDEEGAETPTQEAMSYYTATYEMNRDLRAGVDPDPEHTALLDTYIADQTTTRDYYGFRGTEVDDTLRGLTPSEMVGRTYTEESYTSSTSVDGNQWNYIFPDGANVEGHIAGPPAEIKVFMPSGTHVGFDELEDTTEAVLPRGTTFTVTSAETRHDDTIGDYTHMEVVADTSTAAAVSQKARKYSEDQPRDDHGRFSTVDGGGGDSPPLDLDAQFAGNLDKINAWASEHLVTYPYLHTVERIAAREYTTTGFTHINSALRREGGAGTDASGNPLTDLEMVDISKMAEAIDRSPIPVPMVMYRGAADLPDYIRPGATFYDQSFTSASLSSDVAGSFAPSDGYLIRIEAPAGTDALYTGSFADPGEAEVLLQRAQAFTVQSIDEEAKVVNVLAGHSGS